MWEPFHEKINDLLILEKKARADNNPTDGAKACRDVVSLLIN